MCYNNFRTTNLTEVTVFMSVCLKTPTYKLGDFSPISMDISPFSSLELHFQIGQSSLNLWILFLFFI